MLVLRQVPDMLSIGCPPSLCIKCVSNICQKSLLGQPADLSVPLHIALFCIHTFPVYCYPLWALPPEAQCLQPIPLVPLHFASSKTHTFLHMFLLHISSSSSISSISSTHFSTCESPRLLPGISSFQCTFLLHTLPAPPHPLLLPYRTSLSPIAYMCICVTLTVH